MVEALGFSGLGRSFGSTPSLPEPGAVGKAAPLLECREGLTQGFPSMTPVRS